MKFRVSNKKDIDKIMEIIDQAKESIKKLGINQWQKGYPNKESVEKDVNNGVSYVLEENNEIIGTIVVTFLKEDAYEKIQEGKWLTYGDYGVIHRIAVNTKGTKKGVASELLKYAENICKEKGIYSIKVDTHEGNEPMKALLKKNGYEYCGIIYLDREPDIGEKRIALEKILK